ncbi:hypothetical protein FC699_34280, partial [Bacillus wiedmannii]
TSRSNNKLCNIAFDNHFNHNYNGYRIAVNPNTLRGGFIMFKKIIVSSMALTMLGGAATMLETPTAQA